MSGALTAAETHSPESPRWMEASPFIKLIRAVPRRKSSATPEGAPGTAPGGGAGAGTCATEGAIATATAATITTALQLRALITGSRRNQAWMLPNRKYSIFNKLPVTDRISALAENHQRGRLQAVHWIK
jgi:hypothetical protein